MLKKQASQEEVIIIDEGKQAKVESRDNSSGLHQRGDNFKVERNIHQYIKSAGMGSANTLEIEPNGAILGQRSDVNKKD